ncbi:MAG: aldehyde dehydrogenase family protein, partial [Planctomycetes bacterium]|nr:aldehyde dehydrogenase family protein [Planctomycetota bacterium]
ARRCIGATVDVMRRAIERVGAPPDLVCCLSNPTLESTGALMKHKDVALILATGGTGLVKAAYSSGKPAYGVGPGNVPVYVDRTADVAWAAQCITASQSFDNGTLCCSEQGIVMDAPIAKQLVAELVKRGAHVCSEHETAQLAKYCNKGGHMNADVVGLDPWRIAELAGFSVPRCTTILLAHQGGVGKDWPLAIEILAPVLSLHTVDGWREGCKVSIQMLQAEGLGHTLGIHCKDQAVLDAFFVEKPANRIVVNGPCSQGAVGYSTNLMPSFSLGCGPQAGNITSDNITARHLVNVKRAAFPRRDWADIERRDHARVAQWTGDPAPRGSGLPGDPGLAASRVKDPSSSALASSDPASNWRGNPAFGPTRTASSASVSTPTATATLLPKVDSALKATPAPRPGTASGSVSSPVASPAPCAKAGSACACGGGGTCGGACACSAPTATTSAASAPAASAPAYPSAPASFTRPTATATAPIRPAAPAPGVAPARTAHVGAAFTPQEIQVILSHAGAGCPMGPCKGCAHHEVTTGACHA